MNAFMNVNTCVTGLSVDMIRKHSSTWFFYSGFFTIRIIRIWQIFWFLKVKVEGILNQIHNICNLQTFSNKSVAHFNMFKSFLNCKRISFFNSKSFSSCSFISFNSNRVIASLKSGRSNFHISSLDNKGLIRAHLFQSCNLSYLNGNPRWFSSMGLAKNPTQGQASAWYPCIFEMINNGFAHLHFELATLCNFSIKM